jgi:hypothetical protein
MKPHKLLRAASALTFVHALLNTFAGLLSGTSHDPQEAALLNAMKALRFDAMGSLRTYWDFYFGFGLFLTVNLLLLSVVLWQLASLVKAEPAQASPFIASIGVTFLAFALLSGLYFFIAPLIIEAITSLMLGLAYAASRTGRP